jgi:hypothetical protein
MLQGILGGIASPGASLILSKANIHNPVMSRLGLNMLMLRRGKTKKRGINGGQLNAGWDHARLFQFAPSASASTRNEETLSE